MTIYSRTCMNIYFLLIPRVNHQELFSTGHLCLLNLTLFCNPRTLIILIFFITILRWKFITHWLIKRHLYGIDIVLCNLGIHQFIHYDILSDETMDIFVFFSFGTAQICLLLHICFFLLYRAYFTFSKCLSLDLRLLLTINILNLYEIILFVLLIL